MKLAEGFTQLQPITVSADPEAYFTLGMVRIEQGHEDAGQLGAKFKYTSYTEIVTTNLWEKGVKSTKFYSSNSEITFPLPLLMITKSILVSYCNCRYCSLFNSNVSIAGSAHHSPTSIISINL